MMGYLSDGLSWLGQTRPLATQHRFVTLPSPLTPTPPPQSPRACWARSARS